MRPQRQITREQVLHKRDEARRTALGATDKALAANTAAEYSQHVRAACKATRDYEIWSRVLPSL